VENLFTCFKFEIYDHEKGQNNLIPATQEVSWEDVGLRPVWEKS
jgi:hypothetical protein